MVENVIYKKGQTVGYLIVYVILDVVGTLMDYNMCVFDVLLPVFECNVLFFRIFILFVVFFCFGSVEFVFNQYIVFTPSTTKGWLTMKRQHFKATSISSMEIVYME